MDVHICPFCNRDQEEGFCEHFVATLCDDSDGFDVVMPLYFGWDGESPSHDTMIGAVQGFLEQVLQLLQAAVTLDPAARKSLRARCDGLPGGEKLIASLFLDELERFLAEADEADEPEIGPEDLACELYLEQPCRQAFEDFFRASGGNKAEPYEIAHSPGLTWTGTDFWASSGGSDCVRRMTQAANEASSRLQSVLEASAP